MIYKGGIARQALCLYLGVTPEVIRDVDWMSAFEDDSNASEAGGTLDAYMATRDCSINEVAIVNGVLHWTKRAEESFLNRRVTLLEGTPRAYIRAARFAARFCFSLDTGDFDIINISRDESCQEEAILQWSKAIDEGCDEAFLIRVNSYWSPGKYDQPLPWRSVTRKLLKRTEDEIRDLILQDIELSFD